MPLNNTNPKLGSLLDVFAAIPEDRSTDKIVFGSTDVKVDGNSHVQHGCDHEGHLDHHRNDSSRTRTARPRANSPTPNFIFTTARSGNV
jgi:hypothetical protein